MTNGTPGTADHEDDHTVTVAFTGDFFEKTVANLTRGTNPATTAQPGDRLRYTLRLRSTRRHRQLHAARRTRRAERHRLVRTRLAESRRLAPGRSRQQQQSAGRRPGHRPDQHRQPEPARRWRAAAAVRRHAGSRAARGHRRRQPGRDRGRRHAVRAQRRPERQRPGRPDRAGRRGPDADHDHVADCRRRSPRRTRRRPRRSAKCSATAITVPVDAVHVPALRRADPRRPDARRPPTCVSSASRRSPGRSRGRRSTSARPRTSSSPIRRSASTFRRASRSSSKSRCCSRTRRPTSPACSSRTRRSYLFNRNNGNVTTQRPGGPGTTPPMTIVAPDQLTLEKSGPADMGIGVPGDLHAERAQPERRCGVGPRRSRTACRRRRPAACATPRRRRSRRSCSRQTASPPAAPPLVAGTDFSVTFAGDPTCTLTLKMLTPAAAIGCGPAPDRHATRRCSTRTRENGASLTNVAGATEWFSANPSNPAAAGQLVTYTRTLTDGTVGVLDHQDAHTTLVLRPTMRFEKTVANVTTGANPATEATPGRHAALHAAGRKPVGRRAHRLRAARRTRPAQRRRRRSRQAPSRSSRSPAGADATGTSPTGGARGTGLLDVRNLTLPASGGVVTVVFDVTLAPVIANGTVVANQSYLNVNAATLALSDDPNVNGQADPDVPNDDDPTRVTIVSAPAFVVQKISTDLTRRPERAARRRDAALHDHGQERRHRQRHRCRAARRRCPSTRPTWPAARR